MTGPGRGPQGRAEIGSWATTLLPLRRDPLRDDLLHRALRSADVDGLVLGHTRWASIGIISEPNAHPQVSDELDAEPRAPGGAREVTAGPQRRRRQLRGPGRCRDGLRLPAEVTTDAKVIPTLVSRGLRRREGAP